MLITVASKRELASIYALARGERNGKYFFFLEGESLLDVKNFDETQAILLTTTFPYNFPNLALVYTNNQGKAVQLSIVLSEQDGSYQLIGDKPME